MVCHETPGNSIFIKVSIASRWVKNASWLDETDSPLQIAWFVCFPKSKKVPFLVYTDLETEFLVIAAARKRENFRLKKDIFLPTVILHSYSIQRKVIFPTLPPLFKTREICWNCTSISNKGKHWIVKRYSQWLLRSYISE